MTMTTRRVTGERVAASVPRACELKLIAYGDVMENDRRTPDRLPDPLWTDTLVRVRGEFDEMRCLCLTPVKARVLLGLGSDEVSSAILDRLSADGFLEQNGNGEYIRRER
jgi:hypothetical protein